MLVSYPSRTWEWKKLKPKYGKDKVPSLPPCSDDVACLFAKHIPNLACTQKQGGSAMGYFRISLGWDKNKWGK